GGCRHCYRYPQCEAEDTGTLTRRIKPEGDEAHEHGEAEENRTVPDRPDRVPDRRHAPRETGQRRGLHAQEEKNTFDRCQACNRSMYVVAEDAKAHNFTVECKELRAGCREAGHRSGGRRRILRHKYWSPS